MTPMGQMMQELQEEEAALQCEEPPSEVNTARSSQIDWIDTPKEVPWTKNGHLKSSPKRLSPLSPPNKLKEPVMDLFTVDIDKESSPRADRKEIVYKERPKRVSRGHQNRTVKLEEAPTLPHDPQR